MPVSTTRASHNRNEGEVMLRAGAHESVGARPRAGRFAMNRTRWIAWLAAAVQLLAQPRSSFALDML